MSKTNSNWDSGDWVVTLLFVGFVALGVGLVVFLAYYLFTPLITQINIYLSNYGRMTAEVFSLVTMVGYGLRFHEKIVNALIEKFDNLSQNQEARLTEMNKYRNEAYMELQRVKSKVIDQEKSETGFKERLRELTHEIVSLETEIERLKNPEAVAKKEQAHVQKENDRELKAIADSIKWGRV
jgi:predicted RNase H-like nuclease (RuvC/YqgF family)